MTYLSDDIWYMVCTQLRHQRDFTTLFNCACSGKQLATIALMNLYREHEIALFTNGGIDEEIPAYYDELGRTNHGMMMLQELRSFEKSARLWRTIILSSLGKTLYPYCQSIRTLDLGNLEEMFMSKNFKLKTRKDFFGGELAQFRVFSSRRLDIVKTINLIGEAITKQTPLLEVLTGTVLCESLSRWIPRLPRLTHLKPWLSTAIMGKNGTLIRRHCSSFKGLNIRTWERHNSNNLVAFLDKLSPQSLESFETSYNYGLGPKVFKALRCHTESLAELRLTRLKLGVMLEIPLLQGCTNLVSLSLAGDELVNASLTEIPRNVLLDTVAWLKECKKLRILALDNICGAPDLMTLAFLENSFYLTSLIWVGKGIWDTQKFFGALGNQTKLKSLSLDVFTIGEADIRVESLSKLVDLTDLTLGRLVGFCHSFVDRHILQLAYSLPKLEVLSMSGYCVTKVFWGAVASLRSLRRLELEVVEDLTTDGIFDFIEKLGPGNKGLVLSVASRWNDFSQVKQYAMHETINKKVQGRFQHISRDPGFWRFPY